MFRLVNPTNVHHNSNVAPSVSGSILTFAQLRDDDIVVNISEDNKTIDVYYHSQVASRDKVLTITAFGGSESEWNEILTVAEMLGDIPGVERLLWYHIAKWMTVADKSTYATSVINSGV